MTNFLSSNNVFSAKKGDSVEAFKASMGIIQNKNTQDSKLSKDKPAYNFEKTKSSGVLDAFALLDNEVEGDRGFNYYITPKNKEEKQPNILLQIFQNLTQ